MKKTTLAILASALVANAASAVTIYEHKETETQLDFIGSARIKWESTSDKVSPVNGETTRQHINHAVDNNSSRFGFRLTQQVGHGFYALGRIEWRMRGDSSSQHNFDHLYTHQLYAGIGHKQYGELTYGNMTNIADEVRQTDLPNTLSLSDGLLNSASRRTLQYVYKGIDGLKLGVFYGGNSQRGNNNLDLANERKDVWGAAAIYNYKIDDNQSLKLATGTTRERFEQSIGNYERTAFAFGTAYIYGKTTVGLDLERRETEDQNAIGHKRIEKEVRTVLLHRLTDQWNAYTMYAYKENKLNAAGLANDTKVKRNQFMVGTEYYVIPKHLKGFVEWQATRAKNYTNDVKTSKSRNYTTVVGVRAYW
ncbi:MULTISPECIES: porin [unclassified Mannheimia]|uniref:porin n=1 Tax=unclassified Mannheimia TaxID=2645054 RepID=UPI00359CDDE8